MLSMTKVQLNLISVIDMYLFFVKGMRGGVSYISKRYCKSNKKYLTSHDKMTKYFTYLDKNKMCKNKMCKVQISEYRKLIKCLVHVSSIRNGVMGYFWLKKLLLKIEEVC